MASEDNNSPMFSAKSRNIRGIPVVEVFGEIDMATVPELRAAIEKAEDGMDGSPLPLIVDLSGVKFMESMGLGLLIEQKNKKQGFGSELRLVLDGGPTADLLRSAQLGAEFAIYPDLETALEGSTNNS